MGLRESDLGAENQTWGHRIGSDWGAGQEEREHAVR
jgi:hypothetical protein